MLFRSRAHTTLKRIMNSVTDSSSSLLLLGASLFIALLAITAVLLARKRRTSAGNALLLVGPSFSGKTSILSSLAFGQNIPTHVSYQTNTALYTIPDTKNTLRVVDIPGHPRIRDQFRDYLPESKAIVYVVDASTISRNGPAAAEHLHTVMHALTSLPPSQALPSLLVLAHKTDLLKGVSGSGDADALAVNRVKTILERELEKRRASQASGVAVEDLGAEGESVEMGGLECSGGGAFRFADWEGGEVAFGSTSTKSSEKQDAEKAGSVSLGLNALTDWLSSL